MTESEFNRLAAAGYNRIPVTLETFADLDTPLSIYLKLASGPYSYLLESVQGGERFGRYSFIGIGKACRAFAAAWSVSSATTRCAPSSPSWPESPSPTRWAHPTCC